MRNDGCVSSDAPVRVPAGAELVGAGRGFAFLPARLFIPICTSRTLAAAKGIRWTVGHPQAQLATAMQPDAVNGNRWKPNQPATRRGVKMAGSGRGRDRGPGGMSGEKTTPPRKTERPYFAFFVTC